MSLKRAYEGTVAIVTGAASGIGRALAIELARHGAEVVLGDLQDVPAREAAETIVKAGGKASAAHLDVADFKAVESLINGTFERTGRLDYLFNNAGIAVGGYVDAHTIDDWNAIIDVNIRGVVNGTQAAYPVMLKQGRGHIVNTASMAGLAPAPLATAYSMTKHAVVGLSMSLRAEAALKGIRVSVICPGVVRTAILSGGKYGRLRLDATGEHVASLFERLHPMPADRFARKVVKAVARNKAVIIAPGWWKLLWLFSRLFPSLAVFMTRRAIKDGEERFARMREPSNAR